MQEGIISSPSHRVPSASGGRRFCRPEGGTFTPWLTEDTDRMKAFFICFMWSKMKMMTLPVLEMMVSISDTTLSMGTPGRLAMDLSRYLLTQEHVTSIEPTVPRQLLQKIISQWNPNFCKQLLLLREENKGAPPKVAWIRGYGEPNQKT